MATNAIKRDARASESREAGERKQAWKRPETLPSPDPQPGYQFRWIRTATLGVTDATNISSKMREGWTPVKAEDHPEMMVFADATTGRFAENIVVGGLILCKAPVELVKERSEYYQGQTQSQMESVDNNFMRENDPRMPMFRERQSKVTFGNGS